MLPTTYSRLRLLRSCLRVSSSLPSSLRPTSGCLQTAPTPCFFHTQPSPLRCQGSRPYHESESASYDGPGKSTVSIMNDEVPLLMVNTYSTLGFRLNNGMKAYGPIAILPTCVLAWKVTGPEDINEATLAFFALINPKPSIIILGCGNDPSLVDSKIILDLRRKGLNVEAMTTENAISTYNYLCAEGRLVGAALIPPEVTRTPNDQDTYEQNSDIESGKVKLGGGMVL